MVRVANVSVECQSTTAWISDSCFVDCFAAWVPNGLPASEGWWPNRERQFKLSAVLVGHGVDWSFCITTKQHTTGPLHGATSPDQQTRSSFVGLANDIVVFFTYVYKTKPLRLVLYRWRNGDLCVGIMCWRSTFNVEAVKHFHKLVR